MVVPPARRVEPRDVSDAGITSSLSDIVCSRRGGATARRACRPLGAVVLLPLPPSVAREVSDGRPRCSPGLPTGPRPYGPLRPLLLSVLFPARPVLGNPALWPFGRWLIAAAIPTVFQATTALLGRFKQLDMVTCAGATSASFERRGQVSEYDDPSIRWVGAAPRTFLVPAAYTPPVGASPCRDPPVHSG
jgi:hypothetical protein